jgi:hypothetical protein
MLIILEAIFSSEVNPRLHSAVPKVPHSTYLVKVLCIPLYYDGQLLVLPNIEWLDKGDAVNQQTLAAVLVKLLQMFIIFEHIFTSLTNPNSLES